MKIRLKSALLSVLLMPIAAHAAEMAPATGYASMEHVTDYIAGKPAVGTKVGLFGYPFCIAVESCALQASATQQYPRLDFSAGSLDKADRVRLLNCSMPRSGAPCTAILYGETPADGKFRAVKIYWHGG